MKNNSKTLTYKGGGEYSVPKVSTDVALILSPKEQAKQSTASRASRAMGLPKQVTQVTQVEPDIARLVHTIRKGDKIDNKDINPDIPPTNITYEMLFKEIGKEEYESKGNVPALPLLKDEEKEELRIKWWKIWYQIIKGYSSYGKVSKEPQSKKPSSAASVGGTRRSSGSGRGSFSKKLGGTKTAEELETEKELEAAKRLKTKLDKIRDSILSGLSDDIDSFTLEMEYFDKTKKDIDAFRTC
jgi:hypothetical protein